MTEATVVLDECPKHGLVPFRVRGDVKECAEHVDEQIAKGLRPATDRVRVLRPAP